MRMYDEIIKRDEYRFTQIKFDKNTVIDLYKKIDLLNERLYEVTIQLFDLAQDVKHVQEEMRNHKISI